MASAPRRDVEMHLRLSDRPSFDMLVLGCGGGPAEDNLSAYLVKPKQNEWRQGFTSIDGGSCLGALIRLLDRHPESFHDFGLAGSDTNDVNNNENRAGAHPSSIATAGQIFSYLHSYLITHAHWDHISGLVLASGSSTSQKSVYGSKQTLDNLSEAMNGGLWPVLGSYEEGNGIPYVWRAVESKDRVKPSPGLAASIMPLSHGKHHNNTQYASSAFFVENERDGRSFLIFGDVEADSVSGESFNANIWKETSRRIQEGTLSTLFIECSYGSQRPKSQLYGHLSPVYIFEEMAVLARLLPAKQKGQGPSDLRHRLRGLNVCIVHVKDPVTVEEMERTLARETIESAASLRPEDIRRYIQQELVALEAKHQLGANFVVLEQGMRIEL